MLARLAPLLPQGADWVYEPKWDGFRGLLVKRANSVRILSRNRRTLEPYFPEVASAAVESLPEDCSLDRELLGLRDGKPEFSALLERLGRRVGSPVQFVAFDLLELEGEDLSALSLRERRSRLKDIVRKGSPISATVQTDAVELAQEWLQRSRELHLEGVVAKRGGEPYRFGKRSWIKVKHLETVDLVVGGCAGTGDRLSLLLGAYDENGSLAYVGQTTAIPAAAAAKLAGALESLACEESFGSGPSPGYSRWDSHRFEEWVPLRPVLVCEVAFSCLDGHFLRHSARFVRWRPDKRPEDCTLELLSPIRERAGRV
jgi:ATP-dependent DNA ligase